MSKNRFIDIAQDLFFKFCVLGTYACIGVILAMRG